MLISARSQKGLRMEPSLSHPYQSWLPRRAPSWRGPSIAAGVLASAMLGGTGPASLLGYPVAKTALVVGNVALVTHAILGMRRPYAKFWIPAMACLAVVGALGVGLAALPSHYDAINFASLMHFGLSGLRSAGQLCAMTMTAIAWSTAGRDCTAAQNTMYAMSLTALLLFLMAVSVVLSAPVGSLLTVLMELSFAIWLLATVARTCTPRPRCRRIKVTSRFERLPPEPWDLALLAAQHGDTLR